MRWAILASLPLVAACTNAAADRGRQAAVVETEQAKLAAELRGLQPGTAMQCLPNYGRTDVRAYGSTLIYRVSNGLKYRNDTTGGCEGVSRRDDILVTRSPQGSVCAGDIAQTLDRGSRFFTGSCGLGSFVPYRKP